MHASCYHRATDKCEAVQCFCEAGFFGDVVTMPSGMQRRTCNRASTLMLDAATVTWENFGEDYNRSIPSTTDNFAAHLNPGETEVEFAMQGKTTSWVSMGMRSAGCGSDWSPHCRFLVLPLCSRMKECAEIFRRLRHASKAVPYCCVVTNYTYRSVLCSEASCV